MKNKAFERTLMAISAILVFIMAVLTTGMWGWVRTGWVTFTSSFASIATILAGVWLIVHTFAIGKKVNLKKQILPKINLITSILAIVIGLIIFLKQPVIVGAWVGVVALVYLATAILLGRELVDDLILTKR